MIKNYLKIREKNKKKFFKS